MAAWVVLVAVAGGLTLWLQDSAEPPGPYGREEAGPTPTLPEGRETPCPTPEPYQGGWIQHLCVFTTR
ncbi:MULTISPECIES: hypothetical protein [unclassified Streptomyces]|uniref:Uncharacterized protein n=1 Tax=Streptomyces sp. NBC_00180 TaxID=2903632 RepID=A0AAU1HVR9_9ACTN|nr:hypothetical protein OG331_17865 [Streptomyces sp. NBC_01017]